MIHLLITCIVHVHTSTARWCSFIYQKDDHPTSYQAGARAICVQREIWSDPWCSSAKGWNTAWIYIPNYDYEYNPKIYVYLYIHRSAKWRNKYHRDKGHWEIWDLENEEFSAQIIVWPCLSFWRTSNFRPWHLCDDLRKTSDDTFHAPECWWCIKVGIH